MKKWTFSVLLALALASGVGARAQTFDEAMAAFRQGNYVTAFAGFRKLAAQGDAIAQNNLGYMYGDGRGVPKDERQAVFWYRKAAEQGDAGAQFNLALMYEDGRGVAKDDQQAVFWYRKAADQGNANAEHNLGLMYANGRGVPKDDQQAVFWYQKAANQGDVLAQSKLGVRYEDGRGVPKDDQQAVFWYRKAAEQGDASAQSNLGLMYEDGRGVAKDDQQAVFWYRKAADQGNANAEHNLGLMYANGRGVPKDDQQAIFWYRKAAEQGHASAQSNLGLMYDLGRGVPKDEQQAYFWWLLASAGGNRNASTLRDIVEKRLTSEQRASAQAAARNWQPKTPEQANASVGFDGAGGLGRTPGHGTSPATSQADSSGTGFRVARGAVVTNHHVIDGCSRLRVNGAAAQVAGMDARGDLAWLRVVLPGPAVKLRAQRAALGEAVAVAGYPLRGLLSGFNVTTGNLSSLSGMRGDTRLVQITAPVQAGNSGGPMLDSSGNLMGVVVSKLDAIKAAKLTGDIPQNVNFAINANVLRSFLDAQGVEYDTANSDKALPMTAIAEQAKGFTVLVECWN